MKRWEWEKTFGIACALYKYYYRERGYLMALEEERTTRDYLYGRLLALADVLEGRALHIAKEDRETNAARLMQRFAERPCSTWLTIETSLVPYMARLRARRPGFLHFIKTEMDEVKWKFRTVDEYTSDNRLTGEFLLAYHCQRRKLNTKPAKENGELVDDLDDNDDEIED